MLVVALTNLPTDIPHWISRSTFLSHFDQADFRNREVQEVQPAYRSDWFYRSDDGRLGFYIPVVGAIDGRTDLIGTRHRLAVILPHMEEIPIAFATGHLSSTERDFLASIPRRLLTVSEPFWIPDLPIVNEEP